MAKLSGSLKISGDKSISHRALILLAMSVGKAKIYNLLEAEDILNTVKILKLLGIKISKSKDHWVVNGNGTGGFKDPGEILYCGNSGTTARLMIGAVASNPINCTFTGDKSLNKRTMSRITKLIQKMGASVKLTRDDYLPAFISGNKNLIPLKHIMTEPSAQIKSAVLLAGLNTRGKIEILENKATRDHTERLIKFLGVKLLIKKQSDGYTNIKLDGPSEFKAKNIHVASDPSSAAFFVVGALILPGSKITLQNILLNKTRIAFLSVLKKMGGKIKIKKTATKCGEDVGEINVEYSLLKGIKIGPQFAPQLIDEYPIIAIAASQAKGKTLMQGLEELRHKESDRIASIVVNLKKIGYKVITKKNDIEINGCQLSLNKKVKIKTFGDHRIAMSFLILGLLFKNKIYLDDESCIATSYPLFKHHLHFLKKDA